MLVALSAAVAIVAAPAALAHSPRPSITKFAISGPRPGGLGGVIELKIAARNAKTCSLDGPSSVIGAGWEGRCSSRGRVLRIWVAANLRESRVTYRLRLVAHGKGGTTDRTLTITIPGELPLETGLWNLTIETNPPVPIEILADGMVLVPSEPQDFGTWTYSHRTLKFDLLASGTSTVLDFEASGPHGGPFTGVASEGTEKGPFQLKHLP